MILQSLADFSRREGLVQDPAFEYAGVTWAIEIGRDGSFWELRDLRTEAVGKKKKLVPRQMLVPKRSKRSNQDQEEFLVDKAEYVLGIGDADAGRRERRRLLFLGALELAARATRVPEVDSVVRFLSSETARAQCAIQLDQAGYSDGDLLCFRVEDDFLHEIERVRDHWRRRGPGGDRHAVGEQCLVCGTIAPLARLHPDIKGLAGTKKGVPVVSFNQQAFWSYGWEYNRNACVCEDCAVAYCMALNRCLSTQFPDPRDSESKLTRQALVLTEVLTAVYWSDDSSSGVERLAGTAISDPDQALALLRAPYHGGVTSQPLRFHCLLLQGAQGRATVRSYHSELIPRVHQNLRDWFQQIAVHSDRALNLLEVLASLAIRRKSAKLPPNLAGEIYLSILFGLRIPRQVVQLAVSRNRAEADVSPGRAALLQAWLARKPQPNERKLLVTLDPDYPSTGYQLGRLLAVCEQIQYKASDGKLNKSITDRFFSALSTRPVFVFGSLIRLSELRLAQIRRRSDSTGLKRELGEIIDRIAAGELPPQLSLDEQAKFALGYYHQFQANFSRPGALAASAGDETESSN